MDKALVKTFFGTENEIIAEILEVRTQGLLLLCYAASRFVRHRSRVQPVNQAAKDLLK